MGVHVGESQDTIASCTSCGAKVHGLVESENGVPMVVRNPDVILIRVAAGERFPWVTNFCLVCVVSLMEQLKALGLEV